MLLKIIVIVFLKRVSSILTARTSSEVGKKQNKTKRNKRSLFPLPLQCLSESSANKLSSLPAGPGNTCRMEIALVYNLLKFFPERKRKLSCLSEQSSITWSIIWWGEECFGFQAIFWGEEKLLKLSKSNGNVTTKSSWLQSTNYSSDSVLQVPLA